MTTNVAGSSGQLFATNQVHYLSKRITYLTLNSTGAATGTGAATVEVGWLPPKALVLSGATKVITGFDDTNGDDLDIGISGSDDDLFASAVDMNSAVTTTFDDLATANDYSATARLVTCNFTTAPSGNGTTGEALVYLTYVVMRD